MPSEILSHAELRRLDESFLTMLKRKPRMARFATRPRWYRRVWAICHYGIPLALLLTAMAPLLPFYWLANKAARAAELQLKGFEDYGAFETLLARKQLAEIEQEPSDV
jgi:hypothetical protein